MQLDTIAHNLANASTNGFKRAHAVFEDLMYQNLRQAGANSSEQTTLPTGLQAGLARAPSPPRARSARATCSRARTRSTWRSGAAGSSTCRCPTAPPAYTRDGSFQVDAQGALVTNNGFPLQPGITIPANAQSVTIGATARSASPCPPVPGADGRPDPARELRQPGGLEPKGQTCSPRPPPRQPHVGRAGAERPGRTAAGLRRDLQRQRGRGTGLDDPDPARLRAQPNPSRPRTRCCRSWPSYDDDAPPSPRGASCSPSRSPAARCSTRRRRWTSPADIGPSAAGRRAGRQQRRDLPDRRSTGRSSRTTAPLVGDTLTVQIVERVSASQKSNSTVDKNGKIDASITALPYIKAGR